MQQKTLFVRLYPIQTLIKGLFILSSPFNLSYTMPLALIATILAILRVCKNPSMTQQYLGIVLQNNHGQNLFYLLTGLIGIKNYLYYAPIALFFAYGIVEYVRISHPHSAINQYGDIVRQNKLAVMQTKGRLQLFFLFYLIATLLFDFMGRIIKIFVVGQFLLAKYRLNGEFRSVCLQTNQWILSKLHYIPFLASPYNKLIDILRNLSARFMPQA